MTETVRLAEEQPSATNDGGDTVVGEATRPAIFRTTGMMLLAECGEGTSGAVTVTMSSLLNLVLITRQYCVASTSDTLTKAQVWLLAAVSSTSSAPLAPASMIGCAVTVQLIPLVDVHATISLASGNNASGVEAKTLLSTPPYTGLTTSRVTVDTFTSTSTAIMDSHSTSLAARPAGW